MHTTSPKYVQTLFILASIKISEYTWNVKSLNFNCTVIRAYSISPFMSNMVYRILVSNNKHIPTV